MKEFKVRIKTWKEMEWEFPYDEFDDLKISPEFNFTQEMEALLPEDRIITVEDYDEWLGWNGYVITSGIIKELL